MATVPGNERMYVLFLYHMIHMVSNRSKHLSHITADEGGYTDMCYSLNDVIIEILQVVCFSYYYNIMNTNVLKK